MSWFNWKTALLLLNRLTQFKIFPPCVFFLIWFHQWRMFLFLPPFLNSFDSPGPCPRPTYYSSREITSLTESLSWCLLCIINLRIFFVGIFIYNHGQLVMVVCFFFSFLAVLQSCIVLQPGNESRSQQWKHQASITGPPRYSTPPLLFHLIAQDVYPLMSLHCL